MMSAARCNNVFGMKSAPPHATARTSVKNALSLGNPYHHGVPGVEPANRRIERVPEWHACSHEVPRSVWDASVRRRQQFVAARAGVELAAALPLDSGATGGGGGVLGRAEAAAEAVGAAADLARGVSGAGCGDADHEQCCGCDLDQQSHHASSAKLSQNPRLSELIVAPLKAGPKAPDRPGPCIKSRQRGALQRFRRVSIAMQRAYHCVGA